MSDFFAARAMDEMFLTLAPQLGGRDGVSDRPGFVAGHLFAPSDARWASLLSVKRSHDHVFLRYKFSAAAA
jgi:riboflavin biosynthesis pyrimidine reductase